MSFDNSSPFALWKSSLVSSDGKLRARPTNNSQSVWDQSVTASSHRGLPPLATADLNTSGSRIQRQDTLSPSNSLSLSAFPSLPSAQRAGPGRPTITTGSGKPRASPEPGQTGAAQSLANLSRPVTSPRNRTSTPASYLPASGSAGNFPSGLGAGGGEVLGIAPRSGTYSPSPSNRDHSSPTRNNLERIASVPSVVSPSSSQSSLSKISATQIVLLLDTISEREGSTKWQGKAEKIRKLLDSNGGEVFAQFLRRAVILNQQAIFGNLKDFDQGSYKLLLERVRLVQKDPIHARHIAEAIDTAREDNFRDFDLAAFAEHFLPDHISRFALAVAFTASARGDLRLKAEKFLADNARFCLRLLYDTRIDLPDIAVSTVTSVVGYYATTAIIPATEKNDLCPAVQRKLSAKYENSHTLVMAALQMWRIPDSDRHLIDALRKAGPKGSSKSFEDILSSFGRDGPSEAEVANALLFITLSQATNQYNIVDFVAAVKSSTSINWNGVVRVFDANEARITVEAFTKIFNALLPVSLDDDQFDIQKLWGGKWQNVLSQLSFLRAFLQSSPNDVRLDRIPNLRSNYVVGDFEGLPKESQRQIKSKFDNQFASQDAMRAILEVVLSSDEATEEDDGHAILQDVVQKHMDAFVLSLCRLPRPVTSVQESFIERCFMMYLSQHRENSDLILQAIFNQSSDFTNFLCTLCFHNDPRRTEIIYQRAEQLGWMMTFLKAVATPLALDLACMRHKLRKDFDLDKYINDAVNSLSQVERIQYGSTLWKYLRIKADDEYRVQREQIAPQSVPLSLKSVYTFLDKLQDLVSDRDQLKAAQTTCLQTYPRLMNYGAGKDEILEKRSEDRGNKLPEEIDRQMSELFGRMYRAEVSIRDMISEMRRYKGSDEPELQDLFCCIVHGLFDEYICYSEYPEDALEKTALLFGNIIKYSLLPAIPQEYGLTLIMDAVRDNKQDSSMYRFGVEALLQISERLPEWPALCQSLLQITSLQQPEIVLKAEEGIQRDQAHGNRAGASISGDAFPTLNGTNEDTPRDGSYRPFRSIQAEIPMPGGTFHDPDEKSQEKILFVINNLSMDNMSGKLSDLKEVLRSEHYPWFANYLVEQRARLEPNNQNMYFEFLSKLDDKFLMSEIVRETYVSVVRMMNAKSTSDSATERSHLKSLGGWLGSLTVAQDKPIKHENLYFVDLLLEGFDTQRLVVVIPFTCKVLVQGARSTVFKPPNPWLMEIIGLLLELYHFAELKLNLKFEIEVLCKDLELDHKKLEPATIIRERPQQVEDDLANTSGVVDGLDGGFENMTLNGPISRGVRERISVQDMMTDYPIAADILRLPPLPGSDGEEEMVRNVLHRALDAAIQEIIAPVVERSITIASISTAQLVAKDYALVSDVDQYRKAAHHMVKSLAGSLALVTCKEPLRMSIQANIRRAAVEELPEHLMSEGSILMCVNDNLDLACSFVEKAAERKAIPEIDHVIEHDLEERRRFMEENPGREYYSSTTSRWSTWIPEPYKQTVGGLNDAQKAVYEEFDRRVNGMNAGHIQNASTDSGRQIPDVLQESLTVPVLSTPADQPAVLHQSPLDPPDSTNHASMQQQSRVNGFADNLAPHERVALLLEEVQKYARNSPTTRLKDVERDGAIFQSVRQILIVLTSSTRPAADLIAQQTAEKICHTFIVKPPQNILEAELLAFLLHKLCMLSDLITRDVMRWTTASEEALLGNSDVTAALMAVGLMDPARIDGVIATALREHNEHGLQLLSELMNLTLFNEEPLSLRADFANSIVALYVWLKEQPDLPLAVEISNKLKAQGVPQYITVALNDKAKAKQDQMQYIFREWVTLYDNTAFDEGTYATFLRSMHNDQILNSSEDLATFLRLCIDSCIERFEMEAQSYRGSVTAAFSHTDALALLLILFLKFQGYNDAAVKKSKAKYLETLLSVVALVLNHHIEMRGTSFNQRIFARLINSMLHEYATSHLDRDPEHLKLMMSFSTALRSLSPLVFPAFVYGWLNLIVNRVLVETILRSGDISLKESYRDTLGDAFVFLGSIAGATEYEGVYEGILRGTQRNIWVLRHDFPDFLSENHIYFCARIHHSFPQLRNLVLTARPLQFHEEPDPMTPGLKIDRLEQIRKSPTSTVDISQPLEREGVLGSLQSLSRKSDNISTATKQIIEVLTKLEGNTEQPLLKNIFIEYFVTWIVIDSTRISERFDNNTPQVQLLSKVFTTTGPQSRYFLALALADHLRYPNAQTEFALKMFLHLWSSASGDDEQAAIRESLMRVICDLFIYTKPQPWGLIVVFQELTSNPAFGFWEDRGFGGEELKSKLVATVRGH